MQDVKRPRGRHQLSDKYFYSGSRVGGTTFQKKLKLGNIDIVLVFVRKK